MPALPFIGAALGAIGGGSALAGAATLASGVGGIMAANANKKGAQAAVNAQNQNAATETARQDRIYNNSYNLLSPTAERGNQAGALAGNFLGIGDPTQVNNAFATYRAATGSDFREQEGLRGLNAANAAAGGRLSGDALRKGVEYGQNFGSNEAQNFYNNLVGQQNTGVQAGSALAGVGQNYANSVGAINQNAADAQSNGALYNANQTSGMLSGLGNLAASAFGQSSYKPKPVTAKFGAGYNVNNDRAWG